MELYPFGWYKENPRFSWMENNWGALEWSIEDGLNRYFKVRGNSFDFCPVFSVKDDYDRTYELFFAGNNFFRGLASVLF